MNKKTRKIFLLFFKLLVSSGLIYFVISQTDLNDHITLGPDGAPVWGEIVVRADYADTIEIIPEGSRKPVTYRRDAIYEATVEKLGENEITVIDAEGTLQTFPFTEKLIKCGTYRAGFLTSVKTMDLKMAIPACFLYLLITIIAVVRWRLLLAGQGIKNMSFYEGFKLTYIGLFFNNFMIGTTGGDVIKAYYVAKRCPPEHKAEAAVSVFMDRMIGMFALALLAGICVLTRLHDERFQLAAQIIFIFLLFTVIATVLFYSKFLRQHLRLGRIVNRLPFANMLRRVERAFFVYRDHKKILLITVAISVLAHIFGILMNFIYARALGIEQVTIMDYMVLLPIVFIIGAIPTSVAGLGVAEFSFAYFFATVAGIMTWTEATVAFLLNRLTWIGFSLIGSIFWATRADHLSQQEIEKTVENNEEQSIIDE